MRFRFINEGKLKASERTDFGLPEQKKYPMPDKAHVLAAIRMFNHVEKPYEAQLARNIKSKMNQYGISSDQVGDKNRLKKYLNESKKSTSVKSKVFKELKKQMQLDNIGKETSSAIGSTAGAVVGGIPGAVIGGMAGRVGYEGGKQIYNKAKQFL